MVHYKLHYFDRYGRAEPIRHIFAQAGVEFEDYRIKPEQWPQQKANYPNGQVPLLEVDGQQLSQSYAIARFLARRFGLVGNDEWLAAKMDMIVQGMDDVNWKIDDLWTAHVFGTSNKGELLAKLKPEVLEPFLTNYEKILHENGGKHFVGKELTWADIMIAHFIEDLTFIDPTLLDGHPALVLYIQHIHNFPKIKKHIEARPNLPW